VRDVRRGVFSLVIILAGIDIGGTKCAVSLGLAAKDTVQILSKTRFPTPESPQAALSLIEKKLRNLINIEGVYPKAVGVSCGGPLNSHRGLILSPPNLPGWDEIDVVTPFKRAFRMPAGLQNDANAGALAEWRWGAGRGTNNMIFLTFGTGMGAGLILDGKLYSGANDLAGEVGHIRVADSGPIGYGKSGSFEGFCSGGGIAYQAKIAAEESISLGEPPSFCSDLDGLPFITAETVGEAARKGDPIAVRIYKTAARQLGRGLAVLVDTLNPEMIVIGSIYERQRALLENDAMESLREEALPAAVEACRIVPSELGESIGDMASLSVALEQI
jgi:glucokinase